MLQNAYHKRDTDFVESCQFGNYWRSALVLTHATSAKTAPNDPQPPNQISTNI